MVIWKDMRRVDYILGWEIWVNLLVETPMVCNSVLFSNILVGWKMLNSYPQIPISPVKSHNHLYRKRDSQGKREVGEERERKRILGRIVLEWGPREWLINSFMGWYPLHSSNITANKDLWLKFPTTYLLGHGKAYMRDTTWVTVVAGDPSPGEQAWCSGTTKQDRLKRERSHRLRISRTESSECSPCRVFILQNL